MAGLSETNPVDLDLDAYCTNEIRRHEPPADSPLVSGAKAGALITFFVDGLLYYLPESYAAAAAGNPWRLDFDDLPTQLFLTVVVFGGFFGVVAHWLLSVTVGRLRVTFDAARSAFYVGGILGAVFGASQVMVRELSSSSTGIRLNWHLYSSEITTSALGFAALGAVVTSVAVALWRRPRPSAGHTSELALTDDENRGVRVPRFDQLSQTRDGNKTRVQFGLKRLMALTALVAILISLPLTLYRQLMTIPELETQKLTFAVFLVAGSLFVLPYGLWVVMRGPDVFARLASTTQACRDHRRRDHQRGGNGTEDLLG